MADKQTEHGALWIKTSARGEYMTGTVQIGEIKVKVVAFKNTNKKNQNEPDWRILESKPMEQKTNDLPTRTDEEKAEDINPENIPF